VSRRGRIVSEGLADFEIEKTSHTSAKKARLFSTRRGFAMSAKPFLKRGVPQIDDRCTRATIFGRARFRVRHHFRSRSSLNVQARIQSAQAARGRIPAAACRPQSSVIRIWRLSNGSTELLDRLPSCAEAQGDPPAPQIQRRARTPGTPAQRCVVDQHRRPLARLPGARQISGRSTFCHS